MASSTSILLDGRQFRSDQACGDATLSTEPPCAEALDPARTMLGDAQEQWVADALAASSATWTVIGQQTVLTDLRLPNGAILNHDQWDGYAPARDRLLAAAAGVQRLVVLTGDIHLAGVASIPGLGAEFVTTSISSSNKVPLGLEPILRGFPSVVDAELAHRGYIRHTVTARGMDRRLPHRRGLHRALTRRSRRGARSGSTPTLVICRPSREGQNGSMTLALDAGPTDVPLLDETIGANLARTVAAHGHREALVARHQGIRWTLRRLRRARRALRSRADRPRPRGR